LWDEDGKVYFSHGLAGSRSGLKSVLCMAEMTPDANGVKGDSRIIYDGHETNPTIEGTKLYKRNGYYYIFAPAGGVSTGWQTVLRSKNIWGPYEERIVLAQGNTPINGPHQGAWVDTPSGEDWFIHFQDVGACGRIVHLQPMKWIDDWPVIGEDPDGDGCGQPVMVHTKPDLSRQPICTPPDDDEFNANSLGLQWQWNANTRRTWCYTDQQKGHLRIYSQYTEHAHSLWDAPNLLQKLSGPNFTATTKVFVQKDKRYTGERFSFVMMGGSYSSLTIESTVNGLILKQIECQKANKKGKEIVHEQILLTEKDSASLLLRITMTDGKNCTFHYSLDGKTFQPIGQSFKAEKGRWIGAKIGYAVQRPKKSNDGGWMDIDWIRFTKPEDQLPKQ
jgi:beta-xylosidase